VLEKERLLVELQVQLGKSAAMYAEMEELRQNFVHQVSLPSFINFKRLIKYPLTTSTFYYYGELDGNGMFLS